MSDFLHQLRANKNDRRFNKKRRQYDHQNGNQNIVYDRRGNNEHRRNAQRTAAVPEHLSALSVEMMTAIRDLLEGLAENQIRMAAAEERRAEAMENVAASLATIANNRLEHREMETKGIQEISIAKKAKRQARLAADPKRQRVMEIISQMREQNATYQEIAQALEAENLPTFSGRGSWHAQTVHRLCREE